MAITHIFVHHPLFSSFSKWSRWTFSEHSWSFEKLQRWHVKNKIAYCQWKMKVQLAKLKDGVSGSLQTKVEFEPGALNWLHILNLRKGGERALKWKTLRDHEKKRVEYTHLSTLTSEWPRLWKANILEVIFGMRVRVVQQRNAKKCN